MSDKRHVNRLFKKYKVQPYNFEGVYECIRDRYNYCNCPKKLEEYYTDMKYLKSVQSAWDKRADTENKLCRELKEKIKSL